MPCSGQLLAKGFTMPSPPPPLLTAAAYAPASFSPIFHYYSLYSATISKGFSAARAAAGATITAVAARVFSAVQVPVSVDIIDALRARFALLRRYFITQTTLHLMRPTAKASFHYYTPSYSEMMIFCATPSTPRRAMIAICRRQASTSRYIIITPITITPFITIFDSLHSHRAARFARPMMGETIRLL